MARAFIKTEIIEVSQILYTLILYQNNGFELFNTNGDFITSTIAGTYKWKDQNTVELYDVNTKKQPFLVANLDQWTEKIYVSLI